MKLRNYSYSAPMVLARRAGLKTETRRTRGLKEINQDPDDWELLGVCTADVFEAMFKNVKTFEYRTIRCPYGKPGDQLWMRETCRAHELTDDEARSERFMRQFGGEAFCLDGVVYAADGAFRKIENTREAADAWMELNAYRGKRGATVPSIHMPRWASRGLDEVIEIRIERLQEISEEDARAEGVESLRNEGEFWRDYTDPDGKNVLSFTRCFARESFKSLWESINGPGSWEANPWVWVVKFKVVKL